MSASRLAPEWEHQDAIAIVWPHPYSDWAHALDRIEPAYLEICKYVGRQQAVILVAYNDAHASVIKNKLKTTGIDCKNFTFTTIPTNDTWIRDYGPVCTVSGHRKILLDFQFDGWGQKYDYRLDNAVNVNLARDLKFEVFYQYIDQVLEAGNIEINGQGELLCSRTCFRRSRNLSYIEFARLEKQFELWLGCCKTYWLDDVQLAGDDTCGHIDTLARFCANDIIAYSAPCNRNDVNHETLGRLSMQLAEINRQSSNKYELVPLPLPDPISPCGQQLPATYTNFLVTNNHVLVPVFHDKQDDYALKLVDELFPSRDIIDIESSALIHQRGGLHCAAMQIPKGFIS